MKIGRIGLIVGLLGVGVGGCAKVSSMWSSMTSPPPAAPVNTDIAAVAQGEREDGAAANSATKLSPSEAAEIFTQVPSEPVKIPVVNVFGELDGLATKTAGDSGDSGFQQHTFSDEGFDADASVDPTGKWIVFSSTRHSTKPEIYTQRVDGTSVTQLTNDPSDNCHPTFSPDGKTIAFCSTRNGSWDLYSMDIDGRNVTQITSGPAQDMHPSFSPDGSQLAYCSIGGRSNQWEIWVINLSTRERKMVGTGLFPRWSPDKSVDRIAFQRARQRGSRWFSLWTLDLVEGEARRVTEVAVSSNSAIVSPAWSPDGKRLAFSTIVEPAQMNKGKPRGQQDVWVVDADGGNRHRLTDGNGVNLSPFWASDNRVYFVSDRGGHENVWSVKTQPASNWPVAGIKAPSKTAVGSTDPAEVIK